MNEDNGLFVEQEEDVEMEEEAVSNDENNQQSRESTASSGEDTEMQDAREDPSDDILADDPVVQEFSVVSTNNLGENIRLLQYPTRSVYRPFVEDQGRGVREARIKPKAGLIEVDIPIETRKFYDKEKGDNWDQVNKQTFGGVLKQGQGRYMVGVFKDGELHVSPIHSVAQLRPQFKYFDNQMAAEKDASRSLRAETSGHQKEARAVQMTAKSSSDLAPKFSGALAARKIADEEQYVKLDWFDRDSNESWDVSEKLISEPTQKQKLYSSMTQEQYFDYFNK